MILAIIALNIVHCEAVISSVNGDVFKQFMNQVKQLWETEKFTFVMDNVNFHHMTSLIEGTIHDIRFLPPYSPFLNPCEETPPIGNDDLIGTMRDACGHVTSAHLNNYIGHAESHFEDCLLLNDINRE
ncbi:hypothetical protein RF11_11289 [Thelohanellus kitauei]|uniref:Tc1-like transposase DDE domain-containing protein n=1 Tax=Thelohanellus kitauei TaxID=669202 RepID=A0A0C2MA54_THEKT|nr:hypothetical protein RF11_11289 [Thelohanellus kitauei]